MEADRLPEGDQGCESPTFVTRFFHVAFIVPDLHAAMDEFHAALGIERRAPVDAIVPRRGPDAVIEPKAKRVLGQA
jgi:hypothetical protein